VLCQRVDKFNVSGSCSEVSNEVLLLVLPPRHDERVGVPVRVGGRRRNVQEASLGTQVLLNARLGVNVCLRLQEEESSD